jgi:septal ring factor EnvC (AmiA/AmiB activator)
VVRVDKEAQMAKQENDTGVLNKLAGRGEEAVNRLMEELGKNERVTDALARAMEAKGKVDERTRKTLGTVGLAAADQLEELRKQLERLEKRLAALEKTEAASGSGATATGTAAKRATAAKSARTTAARPKTPAPKATGKGSTGDSPASPSSSSAPKKSPEPGSGSPS